MLAALIGAAAGFGLDLIDVPSPTLFAGLVAGCVVALTAERSPTLSRPVSRACQAVIGATIGATITIEALRRLASDWPAAVIVTAATLALSVLGGLLLARFGRIGKLTGVLAMIAGGASTITAITRELGADERIVAVIQYLRVLLILVTLPIVTLAIFHADQGSTAPAGATTQFGTDLLFTVLAVGVGGLIGVLVPIQTFFLLGPMIVATVIATTGWLGAVTVPGPIVAVCFVLLGLQVGLRFTRASLRTIARLLAPAIAMIAVVVLGSGLLGWLLSLTTGIDGLTAYLATTPGGLPAVLAIATSGGADATYVFAVQMARLLLVLALAPLLARFFGRETEAP
ncbi:AbrB family transcriptional regulator [Epidermidibacterium keratini]